MSNDDWTPTLLQPLQSAYVTSTGREPNFTNYSWAKEGPMFIDTLDYIFHSPEWTVKGVGLLPHREEVNGPLPNKSESSDHLLIAAELVVRDCSRI